MKIGIFKLLRANKDFKTLGSNFGYLMLLQVFSYLFPLITLPYLANTIGVEGFGKIAFAAAVITWFRTICDWGFNYTATRDVARNKEDLEAVSEIFSNVLWARLILGTLSFMLLILAIFFIPYFNDNKTILLITFLLVPGNILYPEWYFQAIEKMKFITIFSLITKTFFMACVFMFINNESDYILQPLFISLGQIFCGLISMYIILIRWNVKLQRPDMRKILITIKGSFDVFINNFMPNLYNSLAIVLLGFFGGSFANGIFDAGNKLISVANSFMNIIIRVTFPFLSRRHNSHDLFAKYYLCISLIGSFLLLLLAPYFISFFYNDDFKEAILLMRILSITVFLIAVIKTYGTNFLIIKGYEKDLRNITIFASITGFVISLPLVYNYSYVGVAITLIISQSILGLGSYIKAQSVKAKTMS